MTDDLVGFAIAGGLPIDSAEALALGRRAVAAGLGPVLFTEVTGFDAMTLSAALAVSEPDAMTGTGVVPLGARSVRATAMAARTAATLSAAPYLLGVGVSTPQIVDGWHGIPWDASVETTREQLRELRAALDGERRGSFAIPQVGDADVRILLGAMGPRMVELGLAEADGVILNHTPPDHVPAAPREATTIAYVWVISTPDGEHHARREITSYTMAPPYARHFRRLGFGHAVDEVHALFAEQRLREAPARLPQELVDALYVHVDALPQRLAAYREAGWSPVVQAVTGVDPAAEAAGLIDAIARQRATSSTRA